MKTVKASEFEKRLVVARADLAIAQANLRQIEDNQGTATDSSQSYAHWRAERDNAELEVERFNRLIIQLDDALASLSKAETDAALQRRRDAQVKANELLTRRLRDEGTKAVGIIIGLVKAVATAAVEDAAINALLDPDADRIVGADILARSRMPLPRQDLDEEITLLWCFASNGNLVGNQDHVLETTIGHGYLPSQAEGRFRTKCIKRRFRSVRYQPAEDVIRLVPLFSALSLPKFDGPGMAWNGSHISSARQALATFDQLAVDCNRPEQTELIALDPWPSESAA